MLLRVVERVKCGDFRSEKKKCVENAGHLGGGNSKMFGIFTPKIAEDGPILTHIFFSNGLKPPTSGEWMFVGSHSAAMRLSGSQVKLNPVAAFLKPCCGTKVSAVLLRKKFHHRQPRV